MMSIKIITSILIVGCSTLLGLQAGSRYITRVKEIRMLQIIFAQLETEILHYSTFLPEAIEKISYATQGALKEFFLEFAHRLHSRTGDTAADVWEEVLEKWRKYFSMDREEYEILLRFGKVLGASDKEGQLRYFHLIQAQLKNQEKKAEEARSKYERMYRSLGLLGGLALAIILF
jgi:stage III sporulation protein AB